MPYALVPDGYNLEKVTKAQQEAVERLASTNATTAFLSGPASGELVKAVAIVVTPIVLAALAKQVDLPNADDIIDKALKAVNVDLSALGQFNL